MWPFDPGAAKEMTRANVSVAEWWEQEELGHLGPADSEKDGVSARPSTESKESAQQHGLTQKHSTR